MKLTVRLDRVTLLALTFLEPDDDEVSDAVGDSFPFGFAPPDDDPEPDDGETPDEW